MDFARKHLYVESVASLSNIRHINNLTSSNAHDDAKDVGGDADPCSNRAVTDGTEKTSLELDDMLVHAANQAAVELLLGTDVTCGPPSSASLPVATGTDGISAGTQKQMTSKRLVSPSMVDASLYPERVTPQSNTIQPNSLVVVFESFDNLKFCYATPGAIYTNRNGNFHHDDFIGKPFGCKVRSRNNRGYGFMYLLKPTPELWARSLNHRTQIIHELDASMIIYYLNLRPNMIVCESGTGSGALSHCILRTIAPAGKLYTYEFNKLRADTARKEFERNGVGHLVHVTHRDVCGKMPPGSTTTANDGSVSDEVVTGGGFGRPQASVDAVILDLPEPWLAIPHAAFSLKPNARIACYSPCVEQSQRTVTALRQFGFHSHKTMEFRLKEHYVDEIDYEMMPPRDKRPRATGTNAGTSGVAGATETSEGEDTGAEADNEKSEYETEGDQASLATAGTFEDPLTATTGGDESGIGADAGSKTAHTLGQSDVYGEVVDLMEATPTTPVPGPPTSSLTAAAAAAVAAMMPSQPDSLTKLIASPGVSGGAKRKRVLVARPYATMRGHTAFITFATAGNKPQNADSGSNLFSKS